MVKVWFWYLLCYLCIFARCVALQVERRLLSCYNLHMLTPMVNMYLHKCSLATILISLVFKTLEVALVHFSSFKEDFLLQTQGSSKCTTFTKLSFKSCRISKSHIGPPRSTHLGEIFYNPDSSCDPIRITPIRGMGIWMSGGFCWRTHSLFINLVSHVDTKINFGCKIDSVVSCVNDVMWHYGF